MSVLTTCILQCQKLIHTSKFFFYSFVMLAFRLLREVTKHCQTLQKEVWPSLSRHIIHTSGLSECSSAYLAERCDKSCNDSIFQLGLLILELITGQSSDNGGVDLVQWVQESRLPTSISMMIDPDLGNSYNSRELRSLLAVARLCIESVNKPSKCSSQILLRYLTTK